MTLSNYYHQVRWTPLLVFRDTPQTNFSPVTIEVGAEILEKALYTISKLKIDRGSENDVITRNRLIRGSN